MASAQGYGIAAIFLVTAATAATAAASNSIMGIWQRGDGAARVRVAPCGDRICATNIWIRNPTKQNEHVGDVLIFKIRQNGSD